MMLIPLLQNNCSVKKKWDNILLLVLALVVIAVVVVVGVAVVVDHAIV